MKLLGRGQDPAFWTGLKENRVFDRYIKELREYWQSEGNSFVIETLPYSKWKLFWETGDRSQYEALYFKRRRFIEHVLPLSLIYPDESVYVDKDALVYGGIYAENAENIHIFGNGVFDDSSEMRLDGSSCYEPFTNGNFKLYDCKNVTVNGVGFCNSAGWCVGFFHCFDIELDGINVFGQWRYNTDGIDIVNSQRITVRNSFVHSFDDGITLKGIDRYCFECCADILVENCVLWCDWGHTLEIGYETHCPEYRNVTFRNCDILRGGATVCNIQNGDCAYVHDIRYEDIRIEWERFYTEDVIQTTDEEVYDKKGSLQLSNVFSIVNHRFRDGYRDVLPQLNNVPPYVRAEGSPEFAGVERVIAKDIRIYCDEKIFDRCAENEVVFVRVFNHIETSQYADITIENVSVNGKRLTKDEMRVVTKGKIERFQII